MLALAEEIFGQTYTLVKHLKQNSIAEPSLAVGASTELWSSHAEVIATTKTSIFGLTKQLTKLFYMSTSPQIGNTVLSTPYLNL